MWAMFCHLAALLGYVIPLGGIAWPLGVWLSKKKAYPFVDDQGRQVVNFQLSMMCYMLACLLVAWLFYVVVDVRVLHLFIPVWFVPLVVLAVLELVCTITGAVKAKKGVAYRYPLAIPFFG